MRSANAAIVRKSVGKKTKVSGGDEINLNRRMDNVDNVAKGEEFRVLIGIKSA